MTSALEALAPPERQRLSRLAEKAEEIEWPACMAEESGWRAANEAYQAYQRRLGAAEMRALLKALGLRPPLSQEQQREVLLAAVEIFLHTGRIEAQTRRQAGTIEVDVVRCPLMERFMDPRWFGLTACGCFARRKGWYEALEAPVAEDLVMCRKWGDPVCEFVLEVKSTDKPEVTNGHSGQDT